MPQIENLWVYPVKGLDRMAVDESRINEAGTLTGDRKYALLDPDEDTVIKDRTDSVGKTFNGKEIDTLHGLTSTFDPETDELTLQTDESDDSVTFDLETEFEVASEWFSDFVEREVALRQRGPPSFIDRPKLGPSVISTGTLKEIASWFDEMTVEGARKRFRPNIEVSGVQPFWEDRFLADDPSGFSISGTRLEGAEACARCVVPSRDPDTGDAIRKFRSRFSERREETLPEWADPDKFDHFFSVMTITEVPDESRGETIRVGDDVRVPTTV